MEIKNGNEVVTVNEADVYSVATETDNMYLVPEIVSALEFLENEVLELSTNDDITSIIDVYQKKITSGMVQSIQCVNTYYNKYTDKKLGAMFIDGTQECNKSIIKKLIGKTIKSDYWKVFGDIALQEIRDLMQGVSRHYAGIPFGGIRLFKDELPAVRKMIDDIGGSNYKIYGTNYPITVGVKPDMKKWVNVTHIDVDEFENYALYIPQINGAINLPTYNGEYNFEEKGYWAKFVRIMKYIKGIEVDGDRDGTYIKERKMYTRFTTI